MSRKQSKRTQFYRYKKWLRSLGGHKGGWTPVWVEGWLCTGVEKKYRFRLFAALDKL